MTTKSNHDHSAAAQIEHWLIFFIHPSPTPTHHTPKFLDNQQRSDCTDEYWNGFSCLDKKKTKKVDYRAGITRSRIWHPCIKNVTSISTTPTRNTQKNIKIREIFNRLLLSNLPFKLVYYAYDGKLWVGNWIISSHLKMFRQVKGNEKC